MEKGEPEVRFPALLFHFVNEADGGADSGVEFGVALRFKG
jgi:hypothetical protein